MKRISENRRGSILIVTMVITFTLAAAVLVLCRSMRVESLASANQSAALQASSIERGAEQYVLALLTDQGENARQLSEDYFTAVTVGDGYFWVLRPNYEDPQMPVFGLSEESAKLNLNYAGFDKIDRLPVITYTAASSLADWIDPDNDVERDGAETSYYVSLREPAEPYYCKNARLETVEEVLLVRGFTRQMVYGDGTAPPLGVRSGTFGSGGSFVTDPAVSHGLYDLMTIYSAEPNRTVDGQSRINVSVSRSQRATMRENLRTRLRTRLDKKRADQIVDAIGDNRLQDVFQMKYRCNLTDDEMDAIADDIGTTSDQTLRGRVNINTAPRDVLLCLDNLESADVDKLIASRPSVDSIQAGQVSWITRAIGERAVGLGQQITTRTLQWSADILAVTGNGRAFKRCRIVVDTQSGTPTIVYRRDLTDRGWPMDTQILASLRSGQFASNSNIRGTGMTGMSRGGY